MSYAAQCSTILITVKFNLLIHAHSSHLHNLCTCTCVPSQAGRVIATESAASAAGEETLSACKGSVCISCNDIKRKPLFNNFWLHPYHSPQRSPTAVYPGQNTIHNLTLTQTAKVWLRHSTHTTLGLVTQQGVTVHTTDLICVCTHTEHRTLRSLTTEHTLAWNTIKLYVCCSIKYHRGRLHRKTE